MCENWAFTSQNWFACFNYEPSHG